MIRLSKKNWSMLLCMAIVVSQWDSAALFANKSESQESNLWSPHLRLLNQYDEKAGTYKLPYSHALEDDLLKINAAEIAGIKKAWKDLAPEKVNGKHDPDKVASTRSHREKENEFFHTKISELNRETLRVIETTKSSAQVLDSDRSSLAKEVLRKVNENPIANVKNLSRYENSWQIGFCFGRALLIHYYLLQAGIKQEDIAKIFMVGQLRMRHQFWQFHVAVMLRDQARGYLVIDPLLDQIVDYKQWMTTNAQLDIKGKYSRARFYTTDPRKFLPSFGKYHTDQLHEPLLAKFFNDLAVSLGNININKE